MGRAARGGRPLSPIDAFFVAYQADTGVLMQLGLALHFKGEIDPASLERAVVRLLEVVPEAGQTLREGWWIHWAHSCPPSDLIGTVDTARAADWWDRAIDPFREPMFQVCSVPRPSGTTLQIKVHHALADGTGFVSLCSTFAFLLSAEIGGSSFRPESPSEGRRRFPLARSRALFKQYLWMQSQGRKRPFARLEARCYDNGPSDVYRAQIEPASLLEPAPGASRSWMAIAAWMRAIRLWNKRRSPDSGPTLGFEVPARLWPAADGGLEVGNQVGPLLIKSDADRPIDEIAPDLRRTFRDHVKRLDHFAVPMFAEPGRLLPFRLYRRIAVRPDTTGVGTSHCVWIRIGPEVYDTIRTLSKGALELEDFWMQTPVCLQMGAAVTFVEGPDRLDLFISHRLAALDRDDAADLGGLLVDVLTGERR